MSRDAYVGAGGNRSPRSVRRVGELPTVDRSPSRSYPSGGRGSPIGRKGIRQTRSGNNSPDHAGYGYHHQSMGSPYYSRDDDLGSPMLEERGRSMAVSGHHRSRSASRPVMGAGPMTVRYQSLDRGGTMIGDPGHEREFMPIREPRERSLDRAAVRDRSLERGLYLEDELYGARSARQSPHLIGSGREPIIGELQHQNTDLQRELGNLKKELELTNQKLGSSMHSIKTFWSPELKKERALRKEESAKYSLINDQLKLLSSENQKQAMLVRQLEEELRMRMRGPSIEMQQQMEVLFQENEHLTREIAILRDTIKELELRIETQKQTLQARDESIKKLLEMLQNKGMVDIASHFQQLSMSDPLSGSCGLLDMRGSQFKNRCVRGKEEERQMFQQMQAMAQKQLDEFRVEIQRRDQEILAMSAKMKTLEEQHQDYQRHIAVLKESLCAKEEHYNMLQADVEELRQRLDEKNRQIEKKTQHAMQAQQDRNRMNSELTEIKEHMDIKDRKINVLQRKLDLHDLSKKQQVGPQKPNEDIAQFKRQLDDQTRKIEEQTRQVEEQRRNVDNKIKQISEREKALQENDKQLQRRKDQLDQLENSLKKSGGNAAAVTEMNKELDNTRQQLKKAQDESQRSGAEMERLLQLVQMSQEEQNAKEKTIMDLQQALKNAQAKLKSTQQQAAQMEEQRKKEEISRAADQVSTSIATSDHSPEITLHHTSVTVTTPQLLDNHKSTLSIEDVEELLDLVELKDKRIQELEDGLRESVSIATEREDVLQQEEAKRKQILGKVSKLEQRLLSLQTAQALRCHSCRPLVSRMGKLETTLHRLLSERKSHLQEVADMKQEALEAAISEKDAHLALLELSGIRTERQSNDVEQLRKDKRRLMERLKRENELSIKLIEECREGDPSASLYEKEDGDEREEKDDCSS